MSTRPAVHLAMPVDDLGRAREFYGSVLGLSEGRPSDHWVDWNLSGHQLVTHVVPGPVRTAGDSEVDGHEVPIPHFGLLMEIQHFHELAERLLAAGTAFLVEPHLLFPGRPGEQWAMFLRDPAGNAPEFKACSDETRVFAR